LIRAGKAPRPDSACTSADVLTPTERAAERLPRGFAKPAQLTFREGSRKWAEVPHIANELLKLKG
jgi:hypothetical protein